MYVRRRPPPRGLRTVVYDGRKNDFPHNATFVVYNKYNIIYVSEYDGYFRGTTSLGDGERVLLLITNGLSCTKEIHVRDRF